MDVLVDGRSHGAAYSDLILHQMLKEMSAVSSQLEPSVQADWVVKRVQFYAYELRALTPLNSKPTEACQILSSFFFEAKGFCAVPKPQELAEPETAYLLHKVLSARIGAPAVLSLIYSFLGCQIGLPLEFVDLRPTCFLKFVENGVSHFIDLSRRGRIMNNDDLLDLLHTRFHMDSVPDSALLDPVPSGRFMVEYLAALKMAYIKRSSPEALLIIQNALLVHQPASLQLLGERALLHRRLGNFKNALADLKRYFSFNDRSKAPPEMVRVYDELITLLEKQKTTIQIID